MARAERTQVWIRREASVAFGGTLGEVLQQHGGSVKAAVMKRTKRSGGTLLGIHGDRGVGERKTFSWMTGGFVWSLCLGGRFCNG